MKTNLMLSNRTVKPWFSHGDIHISGEGFLPDDTLLSLEGLARHLSGCDAPELALELQRLNGFFACISNRDGAVTLVVDRVRSIPLFYGIKNNEVYVSDDAECVRSGVGNTTLDEVAKQEFLLTGYVTGQDTLFPNVKQVQAGELVQITPDENGKPVVTSNRWYRFLHEEPAEWDEVALREELHRKTIAAHKRLIEYADGRQIAIPLSGGYDSRLIATILKQLGYENVVAFSYGVLGNKESDISKTIAENLGISWHFVELTNEKCREYYETDTRKQYYRFASGWVSIPHSQDWVPIMELREAGVLNENAILVPGHSGDFVAGSHLPREIKASHESSRKETTKSIYNKHYSLATKSEPISASMLDRIETRLNKERIDNSISYANAFEEWDWQERQAKLIVNSVRVYEFWGLDWWLPLWDASFMSFWEKIPLSLRIATRLYDPYVARVYSETGRVPLEVAAQKAGSETGTSIFEKIVRRLSARLNFPPFIWWHYRQVMAHPRAIWGRHSKQLVLMALRKRLHPNGLLAIRTVELVQDLLCKKAEIASYTSKSQR